MDFLGRSIGLFGSSPNFYENTGVRIQNTEYRRKTIPWLLWLLTPVFSCFVLCLLRAWLLVGDPIRIQGVKDSRVQVKYLENKHLNPRILGPFLPNKWEKNHIF
jgi:hypothetical protein